MIRRSDVDKNVGSYIHFHGCDLFSTDPSNIAVFLCYYIKSYQAMPLTVFLPLTL